MESLALEEGDEEVSGRRGRKGYAKDAKKKCKKECKKRKIGR
jgi:hypothetical protein